MEPTKQGVPAADPSSQQRLQPYPPQSALPPDRRAVQRPQPQQQYPPPPPPVFQRRSELSVNAEEYRPFFLPHRLVEQSSTTPNFSASQGQTSSRDPQAGATDPFSGRRQRALLSADQVYLRSWSRAPAIPRGSTGVVGFPFPPARVVRLLKEGDEDIRKSVFNGVLGALHFVMGSINWSVVFLELVHPLRYDELLRIVQVACTRGDVSLLDVANGQCGLNSLNKLLGAVKLHAELHQHLINHLLDEGLFHHRKGPDLLRSIFTTSMFPYKDCSIVIRHALKHFIKVLSSTFGSKSMVECFKAATNRELQAELQDFEKIILSHTVRIAKGAFSNYFLQKVLQLGGERLRLNVTDCVLEHLVDLSFSRYGTYVVRACFPGTASGGLPLLVGLRLQHALEKLLRLSDMQLAQLVQDCYANYVVRELLLAGKGGFPEETVALARRIKKLPVHIGQAVRRVMFVVRMVLPYEQNVLFSS